MSGGFAIESLGAHDRASFSCGSVALDRYLREQASQDVKRLVASCFVAVETATRALAGYYTLAATSVPANELPTDTLIPTRVEADTPRKAGGFAPSTPVVRSTHSREGVPPGSQALRGTRALCRAALETPAARRSGVQGVKPPAFFEESNSTRVGIKRLPRYPILPAALIGRLAVAQSFHRKGLGSALLADAALRVLKGDTKAFALIVEAKDEDALAFYRFQGFRSFASRPMSLFLPLATAKKAATGENQR